MLPASARLRRSPDITHALRTGKKFASRQLVLHVAASSDPHTQVAFSVGKNVGNSVVRHRVTRQLREIVRMNIEQFPQGSHVVVRALPGTSKLNFQELTENFQFALAKVSE